MTAAERSKWLDWKPGDQNFSPSPRSDTDKTDKTQSGGGQNISPDPETDLTKLTKPSSVGFVSPNPAETQIISVTEPAPNSPHFDPLDVLRQPFIKWYDARVHLDAKSLALRQPPTWSTTVAALHRDCCDWMPKHDPVVPPTREEFRHLVLELCCAVRVFDREEMVSHIALREDVEAQKRFQMPPQPLPAKRSDTKSRRWK